MIKKQYANATSIFSTQLAIGSFIIGTLFLIMHLLFPNGNLIFVGVICNDSNFSKSINALATFVFIANTKKSSRLLYD